MYDLKLGTRIYYTGDRANIDGFGAITGEKHGQLEISLDAQPSDYGEEYSVPARVFYVPPVAFEPGPGRRFITFAEYEAERAEKIRQFKAPRVTE